MISFLAPGYNPLEPTDCNHTSFGKHIDEIYDSDLVDYIYRFLFEKAFYVQAFRLYGGACTELVRNILYALYGLLRACFHVYVFFFFIQCLLSTGAHLTQYNIFGSFLFCIKHLPGAHFTQYANIYVLMLVRSLYGNFGSDYFSMSRRPFRCGVSLYGPCTGITFSRFCLVRRLYVFFDGFLDKNNSSSTILYSNK